VENYIEEPRKGSFFRFEVLVSLLLLIVTILAFKNTTSEYLSGTEETRFGPYKWFMLTMSFISFLILLMNGARINKNNLFLWLAVFYAFFGMFSTFTSGFFPMESVPFKCIRLSYWVWVMIISYYAVLHLNTLKIHIFIVGAFLPVLLYFFFILMKTFRGVSSEEMLLLNPVFYISFMTPAILLIRSKIFKISGLLLIFAAILMSYKRSALLAFVTSIPVYLYAQSAISTSGRFKKLIPVMFGGIFLLLLLAFSFNYISSALGLNWGARFENLMTDRGSGRLDIYLGYMGLLSHQSFYNWIMGHGHLATEFSQYQWPHNDILEVLYDFGLVGLIFYLLFIGQLAKIFFDMKRCKYRHFDAFAVSLVIFFFGSMFSMLIMLPYWFLNLAFFWGWVIADFHNAKNYGDPARISNPLYLYTDYEDDFEGCSDPACENWQQE
jgi:hypothetical protein